MRVIICGGGVIGACIAYYLSLRPVEVVVVERCGVACAASGKSGGFLALDWCDGSPLASLARRSFALHGALAESLDSDWGYRRLGTLSVLASARREVGPYRGLASPNWLAPEAVVQARLGTTASTAQVDPAAFTRAMMKAATGLGARLRIGEAEGVALSADGTAVAGFMVDGHLMAGDAVVNSLGPWTSLAGRWLPLPAIYGLKGHSLVFDYEPGRSVEALFVEYEAGNGEVHGPEVFPRPDGSTYVCGLSSDAPLPRDPADVGPDPGASDRLRAYTAGFAPGLGAARVKAAQACYRPVTFDGLPLMGAVAGITGAYVATGHSVWGMLNGPASGEAMADLIVEGAASAVNLSPFDPARLEPVGP